MCIRDRSPPPPGMGRRLIGHCTARGAGPQPAEWPGAHGEEYTAGRLHDSLHGAGRRKHIEGAACAGARRP
eukprot:2127177-Alexandrium_andersonii.AAC.1